MKINYSVINPTNNITLLVETPVGEAFQPEIAKKLMEKELTVEQVGFIKIQNDSICLRMAGGEFCGNAAMSAAVLYCRKNSCNGNVMLSVSGADKPVCVSVSDSENGEYNCTVEMPSANKVFVNRYSFNGEEYVLPTVSFSGITHIIADSEVDIKNAELAIKKWCGDLKADGLGIMFFNEKKSELKPLVYVPVSDTLFWESSCASGTSAVGAYLAQKYARKIRLKIKEPAGILGVYADTVGNLKISGKVIVEKDCETDI